MTPTIAYLAEGKLYLKRPDESPVLIDSPFVQQMMDRIERSRQRHNWKNESMGWRMNTAAGFGAKAMGGGAAPADVRRVRFSGLTRGDQPGQLLYTIDTDHMGGLFVYDIAQQHERRIYHRNQFRAQNLARHGPTSSVALSVRADDGTAHIGLMSEDGRGLREITEGDAVDEAPAWLPGEKRELVFQSAGIGRNPGGFPVALGPYAIQKLDLDGEKLSTVLEEDDNDLLLPREIAGGRLLFIRRPYEPGGHHVSPWKVLLDIVLFPYRLIVAIVHFLNWFSQVFARKPLLTAGGPPREGPEARYLMLWGKLIDAEKAIRAAKGGDAKSLVPATWQLTSRESGGVEQILASGVLAYDVAADGSIVYTNGSAVYQLGAGGKAEQLLEGKMIEHVAIVD